MHCDIIIPIWNQLKYTEECIESILEATGFSSFRLILIDNASDRQTADYLDQIKAGHEGKILLIRNSENLGWVKAVNQGICRCVGEYVCVMNNDTVVYPGWLAQMIKVAEKEKAIGLVNPLWQLPKRFKKIPGAYFNKTIKKGRGEFIETDWVRGFCFLIKRAVLDKIGGLDEDFSPGYYDDWDFSMRAQRAGFKCARAKGAFVRHYVNASSPLILGRKGFNRLFQEKEELFYSKWGRPLRILVIIDRALSKDFASVKSFTSQLLKEQNRVFLISQRPLGIAHTNYRYNNCPDFLIGVRALFSLLNNLRHIRSKRYNLIFCSTRMGRLLKSFPFIRNNYLFKELDGCLKDTEATIEELAALKKGKTDN